ncbi:MAG: helix-turn-helix domain-containing protein, partial [Trichodesmium sp. St19_bin1]|nr:helix-turn-helix domain-containing protein [Trichodesmium sp. St19_bin1]
TELLQGESIASAARNHDLSRDTVYRWNQWFMKNSEVYRKLLYSLNLLKTTQNFKTTELML